MDLIYKVTLGNMNNGDSVSYTPNNSDVKLSVEMNLKQLEDYIKQLNVLYKYLKRKEELK